MLRRMLRMYLLELLDVVREHVAHIEHALVRHHLRGLLLEEGVSR